jgi:hypothetical protein
MNYINLQTLTQHTESEIKALNPNTSYPTPFPVPEGYAAVFPSPQPTISETQLAREIAPLLTTKGHYEQQWEIVDKFQDYTDFEGVLHTKAEQETADAHARRKALVPQSVSMRQARLALLSAGLLTTVNATIAAMPDVAGDAARIEWEYAQEVRRDSPMVSGLSVILTLDETTIDDLFIAAAQIA